MGSPKTWAILTAVLLTGVIGVFAYRHSQMAGKKPHSVNLRWEASPNAASYNIYRRPETAAFSKIGSSNTPSYVDQPVSSGAIFYYGVTTVTPDGEESTISNIVRVEVPKD